MSDDVMGMFARLDALSSDSTKIQRKKVEYLKSPFGYPGSKYASLDHILPMLPRGKAYIEPFGGSGAVLLARESLPLEVYNDRYGFIVDFYRVLQSPELVARLLSDLESTTLHSRELFYRYEKDLESSDLYTRAFAWYYRTTYGFLGKGRSFGRTTKNYNSRFAGKHFSQIPGFWSLHRRLIRVTLENLDWRDILSDYDSPDAVFYLDPPYLNTDETWYHHVMSRADHEEMLIRIFDCEGFVALSGYPNGLYDNYPWDNKISWEVQVVADFTEDVAQRGASRRNATECLWIKESGRH